MTIKTKETPPNPERLIEALRDTGYNFETAIADIIDNSISAYASEINVVAEMKSDGSKNIYVVDNGHGMSSEELELAMTYGADERPDDKSLGKFGLGLKTASTSQCRSFSVVSRRGSDEMACSAKWDLDHVAATNSWQLILDIPDQTKLDQLITNLPPNAKQSSALVDMDQDPHCRYCSYGYKDVTITEDMILSHMDDHMVKDGAGTVVFWEKIDRVLSRKYTDRKAEKKAWDAAVDNLRDHLALVFDRFLDHKNKHASNVNITLNGTRIKGWNPFFTNYDKTKILDSKEVEVKNLEGELIGKFFMRAYSLPATSDLSKDEKKDTKMDQANKYQGIYVYRENRLLVAHDWFRLRARESHANRLRIELNFDYRLDEDFQLDFKKSYIVLNSNVRTYLRDVWLPLVIREAQSIYRSNQPGPNVDHTGSKNPIEELVVEEPDVKPDSEEDIEKPGEIEVVITNEHGSSKRTIANNPAYDNRIEAVDVINDGLLYRPALLSSEKGVQLNSSHEFYRRLYLANKENKSVTMGLDGLFWALSMAEFKTMLASPQQNWFEELRYEVSRILRQFAKSLPELSDDDLDE